MITSTRRRYVPEPTGIGINPGASSGTACAGAVVGCVVASPACVAGKVAGSVEGSVDGVVVAIAMSLEGCVSGAAAVVGEAGCVAGVQPGGAFSMVTIAMRRWSLNVPVVCWPTVVEVGFHNSNSA